MKSDNTQKLLKLNLDYTKNKVHTIFLKNASDTSPSAPSLPSNIESQSTTTQARNVTPSKRPRSQTTDTSSITSSTTTSRPPKT